YDPIAQTVDPAASYTVGPTLVRPNATTSGYDLALLELGQIDLTVDYTATAGAPDPGAGSYTLTSPFGGADTGPAPEGTLEFTDLAVDLAAPLIPATYTIDVQRTGYDIDGAAVTVADNTNGTDPAPASSVGSAGIDVGVAAGSDRLVSVELDQYGTLAGSVEGETWPGEVSDLDFPDVTLDAHRCDSTGADLGTNRVVVMAGEDDGLEANEFVVSGPPGLYCITASHELYISSSGPAGEVVEGDVQLPSGQWLFDIENTEPRAIDSHRLQIKRGTLNLDVVTDKVSNSPVSGAEVLLFREGTTTNPVADVTTDINGAVTITDLVPGTYDIRIRLLDGDDNDQAFPVFGTITIPSNAVDAGRVVDVTAALPLLQASITGSVIAVNTVGEVQVPPDLANQVAVPETVTVTRTYVPSPLDVVSGGGPASTVPNEATDGDVELASPPDPLSEYTEVTAERAVDEMSSSFAFLGIAGGRHDLVFSDAPGYKVGVPGTVEADVAPTGATAIEVVYVALDVDLVVTVTGADGDAFENLTFALTHGTDPALIPGTLSGNVITFDDLPPSTIAYSLTVDDDLHDPETKAITIVPDTDGAAGQTDSIDLTGDRARIIGTVAEQSRLPDDTTPTTAGISAGTIVLEIRTPTTPETWAPVAGMVIDTDLDPDNPVANPNIDYDVATGAYTFEVSTNGTYRVRAQKDDVNTYTVATSENVTVTFGTVTEVEPDPVVVVERGRLTVTATPAGATISLATAGGVSAPNTGSDYYLLPNITYTLVVSASNYTSSPEEDITLEVGETDSRTIALDTRTATVDVSGLTAGQNVIVTIAIPSDTTTPVQQTVAAGAGGTATVSFPTGTPFSGNFLPLTGTGTLTVASTGYRTHTIPIAEGDIDENAAMLPNITTITGTVGDPDGTGPSLGVAGVNVVLGGASATTDANGAYTLTNAAGFASGTIVASKLLTGRGTAAVTISASSPAGTSLAVANIPLTPRNVTVTFTLNTAGSVTFDGTTTPTTGSPQTAVFTNAILETATGAALGFSASAAGFLTATGSISLAGATGDATLAVTQPLITLVASPSISGNVEDSGGDGVNSDVRL
ncbi:MAG: hypothetical protein ACRDIL_00750, partial [Candidatus Limnocylindrales bacterium]